MSETKLKITGHSIVTNGYLINDDTISFFKDSELNHIQITLDGCRENHNRTRFLKHDKSGTYDIILKKYNQGSERATICLCRGTCKHQ